MLASVDEQSILKALRRLSQDRWNYALTYIESLSRADEPAKKAETAVNLLDSTLVGPSSHRQGIGNSLRFAMLLREQARARNR